VEPVETQFIDSPQSYDNRYHDAQREAADIQQTHNALFFEITDKLFHDYNINYEL
jgi:hypothetical protein